MTFELFITILVTSATATSAAIELIKTLLDKSGITYRTMPVSVAVSFLVGAAEMLFYTANSGQTTTVTALLYAVCMGIANTVGTTVGYDTLKAFLFSFYGKSD